MTRGWQNGQWIEIAKRNRFGGMMGPGSIMMSHEAELIFDMTTFKIIKNGSCDLSPQQACDTLAECVEHKDTRILLLVD